MQDKSTMAFGKRLAFTGWNMLNEVKNFLDLPLWKNLF